MTEQLWDAISRQDLADMGNILSQLPSSVQVDTYNMRAENALTMAVKLQNIDMVKMLLLHGANVNSKPPYWTMSPLCFACSSGNHEIAELLIDHDANVNFVSYGKSPLGEACRSGGLPLISLLLKKGAMVDHRNEKSYSPLHVACLRGRDQVISLLLDHGADIMMYNPKGSCLHLAASNGHVTTINLLLDRGAEINANRNKRNTTALHEACFHGHYDCAEILIKRGAYVNARDTRRNTPLHFACVTNHVRIVRLLLDSSSKIYHNMYRQLPQEMTTALSAKNQITLLIEGYQVHIIQLIHHHACSISRNIDTIG